MPECFAISLDVFGTLIDIEEDKSAPEAFLHLSRWLGYQGMPITGDHLQKELENRTAAELAASKQEYPDVDISEVLRSTLNSLSPASPEVVDKLLPQAAWMLRTLTTRALTIVPGAREAVNALKRDYRLAVCSNTQRAYTIGELRLFQLLDDFEQIVFSSDLKIGKPSPGIFLHLLSRLGLPAGAVIHVGDSYTDDIEGANGVDIRTVYLKRKRKSVDNVSGPVITSMWDLPEAIYALLH